MQLSRGWWKTPLSWAAVLMSWAAAVSICVVSGGILRIIAPVGQEDAAAVEQYARPAALQHLRTGLTMASADLPATAHPRADDTPSTAPSALLADDAIPSRREETEHDVPPRTSDQDKKLNLRIARDSERCPKVVCYKWHLVTRRLKPPRYTKVELAGLRLAPSLQHKVENGNIDLLIDAVTQHRTIHGHDTLVFIAVNLAGITQHDAPFNVH
jgi:hypothetical protein